MNISLPIVSGYCFASQHSVIMFSISGRLSALQIMSAPNNQNNTYNINLYQSVDLIPVYSPSRIREGEPWAKMYGVGRHGEDGAMFSPLQLRC